MRATLRSILAAAAALTLTAATPAAEIAIDPANRTLWRVDGQPFKMFGIRVASASKDATTTNHLIAQLDDYRAHRVNSVSVTMMGSSGGNYDPFNSSGTTINSGHASRIEQIVNACDQRGMVVVLTIFYQFKAGGTWNLATWAASQEAVRTTTTWIKAKGWRNVVLNIANEQNSASYDGLPWSRVRNVSDLIGMVRIANGIHPELIVGAGGYDHAKNDQIGSSPDVDALLFDTNGPENSKALYDRFRAAGVSNKPIANIECFGGWTKQFTPPGVYPDSAQQTHFDEIERTKAEPGLSLFFHSNPWCQGPSLSSSYPIRFDLAGQGTAADPGIRWWFERVKGGSVTPPQTTPTISAFKLVNATTDTVVGTVTPGMTIDLAQYPGGISFLAEANTATGCVRFDLDGATNQRTENTAPYAMWGDTAGDYHPWPTPTLGTHTIAAVPFAGDNRSGAVGTMVSRTITLINGGGNAAPTATFTATPVSGTSPLTVAFNAAGASDSDGSIVTYAWDFGDGTSGSGVTTSHTYSGDPAAFNARLTVTDDDGATATANMVITLEAPPAGTIQVNFQPAGAPVPTGFLADTGAGFGNRGNGQSYGWDTSNPNVRDRNSTRSPDQAHDTLTHLQLGGTFTWEIAVANGTYEVDLVAGDALFTNSIHRLAVEGVLVIDGTPTSTTPWLSGSATIQVSDGRLTLTPASGASNAKINFIRVTPVPGGSG